MAGIDWSVLPHIVITPVDGIPIADRWLKLVAQFDAFMTISEFGIKAFKAAGQRADLCPPGVDSAEFHRLDDPTRAALREKMGFPAGAFVVGVMAMNQGRKDFPSMIWGFTEAFRDVPEAFLYLDCEKISPAGWDIPDTILKGVGLDAGRVRFREDAGRVGMIGLNERYNLLDVHMVLAHREGYGLPHGEALATGIPTIANDYCSGREVVGDNERGWVIPASPMHACAFGTWGGAIDVWPDMTALTAALREAYEKPAERLARGARGLEWATTQRTWTKTGEAVERVLERVIAKRETDITRKYQLPAPPAPLMQITTPAGLTQTVINVNGPVTVYGDNGKSIAQQLIAGSVAA